MEGSIYIYTIFFDINFLNDIKLGNDAKFVNAVFVEIDKSIIHTKKNVIVVCIYRHPWVDVCYFNVLLNNMIDFLHKNNYVFLLDNFNVDISHNVETSVAMEKFKNILCSHHLYPLINNPTREVKSSRTIGDNIYCNVHHALNISNVGIIRLMFNEAKLQHYKQVHEMQFLWKEYCPV